MTNHFKRFWGLIGGLVLIAPLLAVADEAAVIRAALAKVLPDHPPTSVQPTPIANLFQVDIGPQVMFVTGDGRYLIDGAIVNLETREDLTETAQADARRRTFATLDESMTLTFDAPDASHQVTVFTDIDCGYCRRLHQQIDEYHAAGISVRYLFYPRSGENTPSYTKAVSVWCADDPHAAMTKAKNGESIPNKTCSHPVKAHLELGQQMGIRGTPAIVLDDGRMIPGYVPAAQLATMLDQ